MQENQENGAEKTPPEEGRYGISQLFIKEMENLLEEAETEKILAAVLPLHAADFAELYVALTNEERQDLLIAVRGKIDPEAFTYLDSDLREQALDFLGARSAAEAITKLEGDDAVEVIEDLDEEEQQEILRQMPENFRLDIEQQLSYPDSSAGRLMSKKVVAIPQFWTVGDTIDFLRREKSLPEDFYEIFVVDPKFRPVGGILLSRLIVNQREMLISEVMEQKLREIPTGMDQEEAAYIFRKYGLVSAPVVNGEGRLVGVITVDDIVHVIQEEAEEDLMKMGGITDGGLYVGLARAASRRAPWLFLNLFTGLTVTMVVGIFGGTIQQMVVLAALMPVVSALGGNVGTQTMTVVVRALATREITGANAKRAIIKEVLICALNGVLFGVVTAVGISYIYGSKSLGSVFGLAVCGNFVIAGIVGAMLPITIHKYKADPALSSGILLTWLTDIAGFTLFLGLATAFLMN